MGYKSFSGFTTCLLFFAFATVNIGCDPIEAITETYADIVEDIGPKDDNKEETVGTVSMTLISSLTNVDQFTVTVLNLNGGRLTRPVEVTCTFTDNNTQTIASETSGSTVDGQTLCSFINGSPNFVFYTGVATAEGVTSTPSVLFVDGTSTT